MAKLLSTSEIGSRPESSLQRLAPEYKPVKARGAPSCSRASNSLVRRAIRPHCTAKVATKIMPICEQRMSEAPVVAGTSTQFMGSTVWSDDFNFVNFKF